MQVIEEFDSDLILQLHQLCQGEWWTRDRSLEDIRGVVSGSDICIGLVDDRGALQAFARILTDYRCKALIFDLIVASACRASGLGKRLVNAVKSHPQLSRVKHLELYCLPELAPFYEKMGFTSEVAGVRLMRCVNP